MLPPIPPNEPERLSALHELKVLDTPREQAFDDLAALAGQICDTPTAFVSLVDDKRQFLKARIGIDVCETPRDISFCAHAICRPDEILVVEDATLDPRFSDNPLVTGAPHIRFYAGVPLVDAQGHALGSLCVTDSKPRRLAAHQLAALHGLGRQVVAQLAMRQQNLQLAAIAEAERVAREMLRQSEERQRLILDTALDGVVTMDASGIITDWNTRAEDIFGWRREEAVGRPLSEVIIPPPLREAHAKGEGLVLGKRIEVPGLHRDGRVFPCELSIVTLEVDGQRIFSGFIRDITDRKAAQEQLERSNAIVRAQHEASIDGILVIDERQRIVSVNQRFFDLWDVKRPAHEPPYDDCFLREVADARVMDGEQFLAKVMELYENPTHTSRDEVRLKDGRTLDRYSGPLHGADGEYYGRIWYFRDISDRIRAQAELSEAKEAAEAASRAKSAFLANMSHEIRTPMTAILGYADLLAQEALPQERRREAVITLHRSGEHLLGIINDILDLSKIEAGKLAVETIDTRPAAVIADVLSLMNVPAAEKGLTLRAEYLSEIPRLFPCDPTRLRQIVLNLVSNAVKFTAKGEVVISTRVSETVTGDCVGSELQIAVRDTGLGMDETTLACLFQPFMQADSSTTRRFGGTGLGLTISRRLAILLGGDLDARSTPDVGSAFTLRLPIPVGCEMMRLSVDGAGEWCEETDEASACHAITPSRPPLQGLHILLAEDAEVNRQLIIFLLERGGAEVQWCDNGRSAVDLVLAAHERGSPFDAVLMDMQMPILDGYDATRELRQSGYHRPIIALTANVMLEDRACCQEAGCDDFASKPVNAAELYDTIRRQVRRRRAA